MDDLLKGIRWLLLAMLPGLALQLAVADELSELYLGSSSTSTSASVSPNVLFILDTSGAMQKYPDFAIDPVEYYEYAYDPNIKYPSFGCDPDTIYAMPTYYSGSALVTDDFGYPHVPANVSGSPEGQPNFICPFGGARYTYFPKSVLVCDKALAALDSQGWWWGKLAEFLPYRIQASGDFYYLLFGVEYTAPQWGAGEATDGRWRNIQDTTYSYPHLEYMETYNGEPIWRECPDDAGNHGASASSPNVWPADGSPNGFSATYDATAAATLDNAPPAVIADGNFLNWYAASQTRFAAVQMVIRDLVRNLPVGTNVGLMVMDENRPTQGGMVVKEFVRTGVASNTIDFVNRLFEVIPSSGKRPHSETLLEAVYVMRGEEVHFGNSTWADWTWGPFPSVPASRQSPDPAASGYQYYQSPIEHQCQGNGIVMLTAGDPTDDYQVFGKPGYAENLPGFTTYSPATCNADVTAPPFECLPRLTEFLANEDQSATFPGDQVVNTHFIGFGPDIGNDGHAYLRVAATRGRGLYKRPTNYAQLRDAFDVIIREIFTTNASLTAPAVSINAFNRTVHSNVVYFPMFRPLLNTEHWPGNLKKYQLAEVNGVYRIVDANGNPALEPNSSVISPGALSFWTDTTDPLIVSNGGTDGAQVELGGAAGELDDALLPARKLYAWLDTANPALTAASNAFISSNVSNAMLGMPVTATSATKDAVVAFMRGVDTSQPDWNSNPIAHRRMAAAPHGVPAIVNYGGTETNPDQLIFVPTNDGFLHALDTQTGREQWAFLASESMQNFYEFYQAPAYPTITYGIDSGITALVDDGGDGIINATNSSDYAWLFFGMRRGGKAIYAMDVTDKNAPRMLWHIEGGDVDGDSFDNDDFYYLAQTWSQPQVMTIASDGTPRKVIVFGGGYDAATQDGTAGGSGYLDDQRGNAVFIVDAETGEKLWWAGGTGSGADLIISEMRSSIAADIEIKDKNEDGLADLLYVVGIGGRLFRFDIDNALSTSSNIAVTGGMIAELGGSASGTQVHNRKFFNKPDAVLVATETDSYMAVNIGSGDRVRPKSETTTENYLFSIKDPQVFSAPASYNYGISFDSLYDATSNDIQDGATAEIRAAALADLLAADGWKVKLPNIGEKSLAEAKTFDFRVFFTTFDPSQAISLDECNSTEGGARLYSMDLLTAAAVVDLDNNDALTASDRSNDLSLGTIPPGVTLMFLQDSDGRITTETRIGRSDDSAPLSDTDVLHRTYWHIDSNTETE